MSEDVLTEMENTSVETNESESDQNKETNGSKDFAISLKRIK